MRRIFRNVAILGVLLVLAGGCAAEKPEVELGAILSRQGPAAAYGESIAKGIQLAVEGINNGGGVDVDGTEKPLRVLFRDDETDPQVGTRMAQELIDAGVPAVIGSDSSDVTLAMAPIFEEAEVILLSPAASTPKLTEAGEFIYRNYPSDELEALNMADYVYNKASIRRIALLANQNEYGIGIKNAFIERFRTLGGRVVAQETYPATADDYSVQIRQIAQSDPPAVYLAGYSSDVAQAARQIREAGIEAQLFSTGAVLPTDLVEGGGEAVEGLVYPQPAFSPDSDRPEVRALVSAWSEAYGGVPDTYAAHGYDAVGILVEAIEQVGTDPSEIRFYLNTMNPYDGVAGSTNFDDNGDVRKFHRIFQIQDGEAVPVDTAGRAAEEPTGR